MIDRPTLEGWMHELEHDVEKAGDDVYRVKLPDADDVPPFFVQYTENWVLLSVLPVFSKDQDLPDDLLFRLLSVNRDMRIGKFALGAGDEVILCAELPTEALDFSEFSDATERLVKYYRHYKDYLLEP